MKKKVLIMMVLFVGFVFSVGSSAKLFTSPATIYNFSNEESWYDGIGLNVGIDNTLVLIRGGLFRITQHTKNPTNPLIVMDGGVYTYRGWAWNLCARVWDFGDDLGLWVGREHVETDDLVEENWKLELEKIFFEKAAVRIHVVFRNNGNHNFGLGFDLYRF